MNFVHRLKQLFSKKPQPPASGNSPMTQKILEMLKKTQEEELTCDEVFALLDQFAEMAARGEPVASLMPLVQQHLDLCGDCREEYESLLRVIQNPV